MISANPHWVRAMDSDYVRNTLFYFIFMVFQDWAYNGYFRLSSATSNLENVHMWSILYKMATVVSGGVRASCCARVMSLTHAARAPGASLRCARAPARSTAPVGERSIQYLRVKCPLIKCQTIRIHCI